MKHITKVERIERKHYSLLIPHGYKPLLDVRTTERAIDQIKRGFSLELAERLNLQRASAPLFLDPKKGLQDNLNGVELPVEFRPGNIPGTVLQVPHSLAKWKRDALHTYHYGVGEGIWTDMNAIRKDERTDSTHSIYVDQYDWEKRITKKERNLETLQAIVKTIYGAMRAVENMVKESFGIESGLPAEIAFVHTEELEQKYPKLSPRERETAIVRECGAVFIRGIGAKLPKSGTYHDGRAPDYDDWSTIAGDGRPGLNGDIFVWHPALQIGLELSSMGIRVDSKAMVQQLKERGAYKERANLPFHKGVIKGRIPLSVGGGIGQSRLCMFLLKKAHVGEVQAARWPEGMELELARHGITLL